MLAAEALRLAAVEILLPTAVQGTGPYPTLAGHRVFDSREAALEDIDQSGPYTPVLSLYTVESSAELRGPHAAADDTEAAAVLEIIAQLAISATENGETYVDAMAGDDPSARLVLAALCAQVRFALERSQAGGIWRRLVRQITKLKYESFALPQVGLRWLRVKITVECSIRDDCFDMAAGGLPEPIKTLYGVLPDESYAKAKLAALAAHFAPELLPALKEVAGMIGPVQVGLDDLSP